MFLEMSAVMEMAGQDKGAVRGEPACCGGARPKHSYLSTSRKVAVEVGPRGPSIRLDFRDNEIQLSIGSGASIEVRLLEKAQPLCYQKQAPSFQAR